MYVEALTKKYRNRRRGVVALDNVSLSFPEKGLVFVLGESGSGKTTLLNILSLQEKPTSGSVFIGGENVTKAKRRDVDKYKNSYFAILSQELNLLSEFSVYKNLKMARSIQGKKLSREEAASLLARFGLGEETLDEMPNNLSGGQRQRVALARAMVKDFKVLITDEPTGALDRKNARIVADSLREIAKEKLVITTTHDDYLAEEFADQIIRIEQGRIVDGGKAPSEAPTEGCVKNEKVRTPIRTILGLAFHGLLHNVPRLAFSLLSCVLTLAVFMGTSSFVLYDYNATAYRAFKNENINYLRVSRRDAHLGYLTTPVYFERGEEQYVSSLFGDDLLFECEINGLNNNKALNGDGNFPNGIDAFCPTKNNLDSFGFDLIGRLPNKGADINTLPSFTEDLDDAELDLPIEGFDIEVAVTKYMCVGLGWIEESQANDTQALKKMMETKSFFFTVEIPNDYRYILKARISGVVDTNFKPNPNTQSNTEKQVEESRLRNEISSGVFFSSYQLNQLLDIDSRTDYVSVYAPVSAHPLEAIDKYNAKGVLNDEGNVLTMDFDTRIDYNLSMIEGTQSSFSQLGIMLSVLLLFVTVFSFAAIMGSSFRALNPSIKVLRSMGISSMNAMMVYVSEVEMLSVACGALAAIPYFLFIRWLEGFCRGYFYVNASPFAFEPLAVLACILVMGLLGAIIAFLASKANEREASKNRYIR